MVASHSWELLFHTAVLSIEGPFLGSSLFFPNNPKGQLLTTAAFAMSKPRIKRLSNLSLGHRAGDPWNWALNPGILAPRQATSTFLGLCFFIYEVEDKGASLPSSRVSYNIFHKHAQLPVPETGPCLAMLQSATLSWDRAGQGRLCSSQRVTGQDPSPSGYGAL